MQSTIVHPSATSASASTGISNRVLSIDVLRGLTIALMILVNDPGDWAHTYAQLDHAAWNGFTLTDLVFPNFLFMVGASIIFSMQGRIRRGEDRRTLAFHIIRRSAIIFALDLFFGLYPHFHYTHLRIFGVLTRIAVCYLVAGLICLATQRARTLLAISAGSPHRLLGADALRSRTGLRHPNARHAHSRAQTTTSPHGSTGTSSTSFSEPSTRAASTTTLAIPKAF